jgi:pimeloyl-ACP methyl ester carboxylesterase
MAWKEKKISINGIDTAFKVFGENGSPFLILHGWGSNSERWTRVGELLSENGLKVFIPDLPGFGKSSHLSKPLKVSEYADFVLKFAEAINLEKFYLLGHSFGGGLSCIISSANPERIKKVFLVGAACFRWQTFKKKLFYCASRIFKIFVFVPYYNTLRKTLYRLFISSDYLQASGVMKETYLNVITHDLSDVLPKINVPTFIFWGRKDKITPLKEAFLLKEKIKNSQLQIFEKSGHNLHRDVPEELAKAVISHL